MTLVKILHICALWAFTNTISTAADSLLEQNPLKSFGDCDKLAMHLISHFDLTGDSGLLIKAICFLREGLSQAASIGSSHIHIHTLQAPLAIALRKRFEQTRDVAFLDEAISLQRILQEHFQLDSAEDRIDHIHNLALSLSFYYEMNMNQTILDESIHLHREAVSLCGLQHPCHSKCLYGLTHALTLSYSRKRNANDVRVEIEKNYEEGFSSPLLSALERAKWLRLFANFRTFQSVWENDPKVLWESIELRREGLRLTPVGCHEYYLSLDGLGSTLAQLSERKNDMLLLEEAVQLWRDGLRQITESKFTFVQTVMSVNLAHALVNRYDMTGDITAQVEAAELLRNYLLQVESSSRNRFYPLTTLTRLLHMRYERTGDEDALEECIQLTKIGLELPNLSPHQICNLMERRAISLVDSYRIMHNEDLLLEAISLHQKALSLLNDVKSNYEYRALHLRDLAIALTMRFERDGNIDILSKAESLLREALPIVPEGFRHAYLLDALAKTLVRYFDKTANTGQL
jgi:hypothetical protein